MRAREAAARCRQRQHSAGPRPVSHLPEQPVPLQVISGMMRAVLLAVLPEAQAENARSAERQVPESHSQSAIAMHMNYYINYYLS